VAPRLDEIGIMTELDRAVLAAYCISYSRWVNAVVKVREEGEVIQTAYGPKINPYTRIEKEAEDCMRKNFSLLGMSPASRASLSIANQKPTKAADKTEKFRLLKHGK
jgi:P27 family predicted phage terminase small subunit